MKYIARYITAFKRLTKETGQVKVIQCVAFSSIGWIAPAYTYTIFRIAYLSLQAMCVRCRARSMET